MDGWHGGGHMGDDLMKVLEEMEAEQNWEEMEAEGEDFMDPEEPSITKVKSFALDKPTSLKEAIFALDYTDHDFYVFRNEETNEINVVYKRNAGGIGHVEP
jgi:putative sigma-54 modulation protein